MHKKNNGFTIVELLVSLLLLSLLLTVISSIVINASTLNAKSNLRATAGSLAFKKVQDYINLEYDNVPIGDVANTYEVEDFSGEAASELLKNATAKVYAEPASVISPPTTTTQTFSQSVSSDTAYVTGPEINSINQHDATGDWFNLSQIRDNIYTNYTYSRYANNPDNLASPSIDLGSAQTVASIRINWYACGYGASNFRIEAKNNSPSNNNGWTTIRSGLADNGPFPCVSGEYPQVIDVSSNTTAFRHWRLYFVNAENNNFAVISELEAFSAGQSGDTVEQHGTDAAVSPGQLYFSDSPIEFTTDGNRGRQSTGITFDGVTATQGATITNAYLNFTSQSSQSGGVTMLIKAVNADTAPVWSGAYGVDRAIDSIATDGKVGTVASVTWSPPNWSAGQNNTNTEVNITSIIQEIVNRPGWVPGNNIAIGISYVSGNGRRIATRYPAPRLIINSSTTSSTTPGNYVDSDSDGDVDNPTLLKITSVIEYDAFDQRYKVEYVSYVRKYGLTD